MAKLIPLDEAAKILGITPEELVEMRSRNEIAGYRDGSSWKFKQAELDRVKSSLNADGSLSDDLSLDLDDLSVSKEAASDLEPLKLDDDLLAEPIGGGADDEGDSILVTEDVLGESERSTSSTVIGKDEARNAAESDLKLIPEDDEVEAVDADMTLAGGSGLDLRLDDDEDLAPAKGRGTPDSGIDLVTAGDDDDDLVLASDSDASPVVAGGGDFDDDELVLDDGDVDVTLSGDSGVNLTSPSDSGISLEGLDDELDLGDGAMELDDDEAPAKAAPARRQREEAFDLTPDQGLVSDDDESSSQVIALDPDQFVDGFGEEGLEGEGGPVLEEEGDFLGDDMAAATAAAAPAIIGRGADDGMDLTTWNIVALSCLSLLMFLGGVIAIDVVRNIWSWNGYGFSAILVEALSGLVK